MRKIILTILPLFTLHVGLYAQLITNSNVSPNFLVQNVLLGGGVTATNISYTGDGNAIGSFNGSACNIGLNSGVIMTTGTVENSTNLLGDQQGPFGPNNNAGAGLDNQAPGDALLDGVSSANTEDAAILEFDFIAVGTEVSFRYVFGSEEYLEYVNAGYNDVFGFFISGQNPSGGSYSNTNIALIPGTNTPVTIDNLNNVSNSAYYNNNGDGNSAPQNSNNAVVQYDGFTDVLTASANVVCGQTYHIKIAIADAGDGVWDSGVFLEAQSFTSVAPLSISSQINSQGNLPPNQVLEGCGDANIIFTRTDSINYSQTFALTYGGSASSGIDYNALPTTVTFNAGQTTQSILVQSLYDALPEGMESLTISITYSGSCGQNITETLTLGIVDQPPLSVNLLNEIIIDCPDGTPLNLIATPSGGTPNYSFLWNTGQTTSFINVNPTVTTTYYVTVMDECGNQSVSDSVQVIIPIYSPLEITVSNDTSLMCPNTPIDLYSTVSGGAGNYQWLWSNGETSQDVSIQTLESEQYIVSVTDLCGNQIADTINVEIVIPIISLQPYGATMICPGDVATIGVIATGGSGSYDYSWNTFDTDAEIIVSPISTSTYFVSVTDSCSAYYEVIESVEVIVDKPNASFYVDAEHIVVNDPVGFINQSEGAVNYYWDFGNNETSTETNPSTTYYLEGEITVLLIAYNQAGCVDTAYYNYYVQPELQFFVPNAFTPNGDGNNDYFFGDGVGVLDYEMRIFNRWGEMIFVSFNGREKWDGRVNGVPAQEDVYVWKIKLLGYDGSEFKRTGHVSLIR